MKHNLKLHLKLSISLYVIFASLDSYFTLKGVNGDMALEGNPIIRYMMQEFGMVGGLVIEKSFVLLLAIIVAVIAYKGIDRKANWVYYLALTKWTREWMKRKKRYWVAFIPVYFVALAQGLAAASWVYLLTYG